MMSFERALLGGRTRRAQRLSDVMKAEALKALSLRSQRVLWLCGLAGAVLGSAIALTFAEILRTIGAELPDGEVEALIARAPTAGAATLAIFLGFAAIHLSGSERASGRDRQTNIEVPSRSRTFVARLAVMAAGSFLLSIAAYAIGGLFTVVYSGAFSRGAASVAGAQPLSWLAVALATSLVVVFAGCIGLVVRNGVAAAGLYSAVFIIVPAALGTLAVTSSSEVYTWLSSMMPAGRLGIVVDEANSGGIGTIAAALGALILWVAATASVAAAVWLHPAPLFRSGK